MFCAHACKDLRTHNSPEVNGQQKQQKKKKKRKERAVDRLLSALHKRNETARVRISILSPMQSTLPPFTARHELSRAKGVVVVRFVARSITTRMCV